MMMPEGATKETKERQPKSMRTTRQVKAGNTTSVTHRRCACLSYEGGTFQKRGGERGNKTSFGQDDVCTPMWQ